MQPRHSREIKRGIFIYIYTDYPYPKAKVSPCRRPVKVVPLRGSGQNPFAALLPYFALKPCLEAGRGPFMPLETDSPLPAKFLYRN